MPTKRQEIVDKIKELQNELKTLDEQSSENKSKYRFHAVDGNKGFKYGGNIDLGAMQWGHNYGETKKEYNTKKSTGVMGKGDLKCSVYAGHYHTLYYYSAYHPYLYL